ncbi:cytochrome c family protein [Sphingobium sp. SYK-6]|uniref:c-type cytochrome n=1 Tax=Sphingobium sp. (strain NBRC 103272 / SYK-6) TaxID=627192 RepID=UPI0002277F5C|nr:cytochrome c [Sphingobium sp. SYK-6]BAK68484.1 cytochrome c family protein [Sphingobium sp. SYK-6]
MKALGMTIVAALIAAGAAAGSLASPDQAMVAPVAAPAPAGLDGRGLFLKHCGYCHLPGGTGSIQLERRWGKARALLAERTDLPAEYVKGVARQGIFSMPPITRVEVTDDELDKLAAYLATADKTKAHVR